MRIFANRAYERLLEEECKRLRDENRQLVNAILAKSGMPAIEAPAEPNQMKPIRRIRRRWEIAREQVRKTAAAMRLAEPQVRAEAEKKANAS